MKFELGNSRLVAHSTNQYCIFINFFHTRGEKCSSNYQHSYTNGMSHLWYSSNIQPDTFYRPDIAADGPLLKQDINWDLSCSWIRLWNAFASPTLGRLPCQLNEALVSLHTSGGLVDIATEGKTGPAVKKILLCSWEQSPTWRPSCPMLVCPLTTVRILSSNRLQGKGTRIMNDLHQLYKCSND